MFTYEFERPSVTVDMVIVNSNYDVLLIKRGHNPGKNMWAIPGGHVNPMESPHEAAIRELKEETSLVGIPLTLYDIKQTSDKNEGWRLKTVYYSFLSVLDSVSIKVVAGSDAKDYKWKSLQECSYGTSKKDLFSDHQSILSDIFMSHCINKD